MEIPHAKKSAQTSVFDLNQPPKAWAEVLGRKGSWNSAHAVEPTWPKCFMMEAMSLVFRVSWELHRMCIQPQGLWREEFETSTEFRNLEMLITTQNSGSNEVRRYFLMTRRMKALPWGECSYLTEMLSDKIGEAGGWEIDTTWCWIFSWDCAQRFPFFLVPFSDFNPCDLYTIRG